MFIPVVKLSACGKLYWKKEPSRTVHDNEFLISPNFLRWILVSQEHYFKDKYLFYRFSGDENGTLIRPDISLENESDEQLNDVILTLAQVGPDAMLRMILRKPYVTEKSRRNRMLVSF